MKSASVADLLFSLLKNMAAQKPVIPETEFPSLDDLVGSGAESEMTTTEIENAKINLNLLKATSFLAGSKSITSEEANKLLTETEDILSATASRFSSSTFLSDTAIPLRSDTPSSPTWKYFHETFSLLDTLKAISQLASVSSRRGSKSPSLPKDSLERLASRVHEIHEIVRSNTRLLKSHVSESGMLGTLIDVVLAGSSSSGNSVDDQGGKTLQAELENVLDASSLELFCGSLMESWEENLDGVLIVRV